VALKEGFFGGYNRPWYQEHVVAKKGLASQRIRVTSAVGLQVVEMKGDMLGRIQWPQVEPLR
jgi:hypothetical protein